MKYVRFLLPIGILTALALLFLLIPTPRGKFFVRDIGGCSTVAKELRFSCFRSVIDRYYKENLDNFIAKLSNNELFPSEVSFSPNGDVSYAIFGTNCHTFYHAVGDFIGTYREENVKRLVDYGPSTCTNGYTMGLYKRLALKHHFSSDLLKQFYEICKEGAQNQCAHEIGHILHDKYSYSILKILDYLSFTHYGLTYPANYEYMISSERNFDGSFEECKKIMPDENKRAQCFTGIGHNLFLFAEFMPGGYKAIGDECAKTGSENRDNCYAFFVYRIGINEAAVKFLSRKFEEGRKVCNDAVTYLGRGDFKHHCYRGIGGGIGLFIDSEYTFTKITEKNFETIKQELLGFANLCEEAIPIMVDECFTGLLGTKFLQLYHLLGIYHPKIEALIPNIDSDFEVVG